MKKCEKCGDWLSREEVDYCEEYKDTPYFPLEIRYICDACFYSESETIEPETFSDADPGL